MMNKEIIYTYDKITITSLNKSFAQERYTYDGSFFLLYNNLPATTRPKSCKIVPNK